MERPVSWTAVGGEAGTGGLACGTRTGRIPVVTGAAPLCPMPSRQPPAPAAPSSHVGRRRRNGAWRVRPVGSTCVAGGAGRPSADAVDERRRKHDNSLWRYGSARLLAGRFPAGTGGGPACRIGARRGGRAAVARRTAAGSGRGAARRVGAGRRGVPPGNAGRSAGPTRRRRARVEFVPRGPTRRAALWQRLFAAPFRRAEPPARVVAASAAEAGQEPGRSRCAASRGFDRSGRVRLVA
jgi:hypothetical protein